MGKYTPEILQRINVRWSLTRRSVLLLELNHETACTNWSVIYIYVCY